MQFEGRNDLQGTHTRKWGMQGGGTQGVWLGPNPSSLTPTKAGLESEGHVRRQ